ncbi:MAG TPA: sigma-70 family RNA polymerase sigma factor [Longimicrobiales bacterium]
MERLTCGRHPMRDQAGVDTLVQRARLADAGALEALYAQFSRAVYRIAYRLTQSEADAEDILQDVFAGLPEALRTYEGRGRLEDWLKMVATRRSLMVLRQRRRRREVSLEGTVGYQPVERAEPVVDRVALQRALARLPDPLRAVFVLKEIEGYSHEEIGKLMGIGPHGSASKLHRARKLLRDRLRSRT